MQFKSIILTIFLLSLKSNGEINNSAPTIKNNNDDKKFILNQTLQSEVPIDNTQNETIKLINCLPHPESNQVQLVNDTYLRKLLLPESNITSRDQPGTCIIVLFYSNNCPFSSIAAPHFNALPRAYPKLKMVAINAMMYHLFNTQNGIVGVPTLLIFHNGKSVAKYNDSDYTLELFMKFITKSTGIEAQEKSHVTSSDFSGPIVSVPHKGIDLFLIISWLFIILCSGYFFTKSPIWKWIVDTVKSNWQESDVHNIVHEHRE